MFLAVLQSCHEGLTQGPSNPFLQALWRRAIRFGTLPSLVGTLLVHVRHILLTDICSTLKAAGKVCQRCGRCKPWKHKVGHLHTHTLISVLISPAEEGHESISPRIYVIMLIEISNNLYLGCMQAVPALWWMQVMATQGLPAANAHTRSPENFRLQKGVRSHDLLQECLDIDMGLSPSCAWISQGCRHN